MTIIRQITDAIRRHTSVLFAAAGAASVLCAVHFASYDNIPSIIASRDTQVVGLRTDAPSEVLSFKYRTGYTYQIISKTQQATYFGKRIINQTGRAMRTSIKVVQAHDDGSATLEGTFLGAENSVTPSNTKTNAKMMRYDAPKIPDIEDIDALAGHNEETQGDGDASGAIGDAEDGGASGAEDDKLMFTLGTETKSRFERSSTGRYTIDDEAFMPAVRDAPVFPETPVKSGDTWEADGCEAEDFRRIFGIEKPFKVPFKAKYQYLGVVDGDKNNVLNVIDIQYDFSCNAQFPEDAVSASNKKVLASAAEDTAVISGYCHQTLYWDNVRGEADHYAEDFRVEIKVYGNDRYVFQGVSEAKSQVPDTNDLESMQGTIADMGIENVTVKRSAQGLTISMERIQFKAESTVLQDSEKVKLQKIADIISPYSNDLLVTGHCASFGDMSGQQRLSEGRAKSVADYLVEIGARDKEHIFTQGKGGSEAIAPNDTAEGRAMNRRVEITLMD